VKKFIVLIFIFISVTVFSEEGAQKENQYIIRLVHGEGSYSTLESLISLDENDHDQQDSTLDGIQLEKYIYRDLVDNSIDVTLFSSFFYHSQDIKNPDGTYTSPITLSGEDTFQVNGGIKAYWKKFPWSKLVRTRFGVGEGLSYVYDKLDLEMQNTNKKDSKSDSHILNYLDFTASFNLKDITRWDALENYYAGMGISHRSGIFGTINGVNGGSNFYTFFLEAEF
jgi:outer membrane protein